MFHLKIKKWTVCASVAALFVLGSPSLLGQQLENPNSSADISSAAETSVGHVNVSQNAGRSAHPVIRADQEGSVHVVWMDDSTGNSEVFYSKWNSTQWSIPLNISNTPSLSLHPSMAVGLDGQVHIAWMEGDQPSDLDIFYRSSVESQWSKPRNLTNADGISQRPQVEVDSLGAVHVVWYGNQEGFFGLYHCRLMDGEWSKPANTELVDWYITHNPGYSQRAAISADNAGGLHMVWSGMDDVPSPYALCQNVRHRYWDGDKWSKPDNVSRMRDMQARIEDPAIDTDALGNVHVSWEDRANVWYSRLDGKQWTKSRRVNTKGRKSALPRVRVYETGRIFFVWLNAEPEMPDIYFRELDGLAWSNPVNVSTSESLPLFPSLAIDAKGNVHVAWMDYRAGEIRHSHFTPNVK